MTDNANVYLCFLKMSQNVMGWSFPWLLPSFYMNQVSSFYMKAPLSHMGNLYWEVHFRECRSWSPIWCLPIYTVQQQISPNKPPLSANATAPVSEEKWDMAMRCLNSYSLDSISATELYLFTSHDWLWNAICNDHCWNLFESQLAWFYFFYWA